MILILILILSLVLRLYRLDYLPSEMWGDVIEHHKLAQRILEGDFFLNYDFGGDGPLASYLIAMIAKLTGLSFYTIKLSTVITGLISTFVLYHLAKTIFRKAEIAYFAALLMAISFWTLSISRQGKPYNLAPLFVMLVVLFLYKKRHLLAGFFIGLGMYSQASFWGMALMAWFNPLTLISFLVVSIPFISDFTSNFYSYFNRHAHFGEKLGVDLSLGEKFANLGHITVRNFLSFNIRGDEAFRHNIPGNPHLDPVTGILFLSGFIYLLYLAFKKKDANLLKFFFLPFILSQLTSFLDIKNPENSPNLGRTLTVAPFAYMAAAFTMNKIWEKWKSIAIFLIVIIFMINFHKYFVVYPKTLPNQNTPFGRIIAGRINLQPRDIDITVIGCCWADWGQPEPMGIEFFLDKAARVNYVDHPEGDDKINCDSIRNSSKNAATSVVYLSPNDKTAEQQIRSCFSRSKKKLLQVNGFDIATEIEGKL